MRPMDRPQSAAERVVPPPTCRLMAGYNAELSVVGQDDILVWQCLLQPVTFQQPAGAWVRGRPCAARRCVGLRWEHDL